jgi:tyrosinase
MRLNSLVFLVLSLCASVFGHAIPVGDEEYSHIEKRAFLPVKGASGNVLPRFEIRQLQQKTAQWNIFLLAMQTLQNTAQTNKVSYYQLAGIHGVPRVNWDDVGKCSACTGQVDGYCTHSSILFLGWHRAYLALFEQQLIAAAKSVAARYTGTKKTTYQNAAKQLRLPYWDWAAKPGSGNTLPASITAATVTVDAPAGSKSIKNPLASYHFTDTSGMVYGQYKIWKVSLVVSFLRRTANGNFRIPCDIQYQQLQTLEAKQPR